MNRIIKKSASQQIEDSKTIQTPKQIDRELKQELVIEQWIKDKRAKQVSPREAFNALFRR